MASDSRYRTFVTIVRSDTLVKAGEALHLTQPTVTRHVQQLEAEFGMTLFDRIGKRLVLNRAGELVYGYAVRLLELELKMRDELAGFANPEVGTIYIGAGLTPSIYLLPPLFAAYRANHPKVQIQVRTGASKEVSTWLLHGEIDMGVVTTVDAGLDGVRISPLYQDDLWLVAPAGHPLADEPCGDVSRLNDYPFVAMREGSGLRRLLAEFAKTHGLSLTVAMETDSLESINRLVQHGVGIAVMPRSSAQDDVQAGRLAHIALQDIALGARTITLLTRFDTVLPACAAQFAVELTSRVNPWR